MDQAGATVATGLMLLFPGVVTVIVFGILRTDSYRSEWDRSHLIGMLTGISLSVAGLIFIIVSFWLSAAFSQYN